MTAVKRELRKTRESLQPNFYAGSYLLGRILGVERAAFVPTDETKNSITKIYKMGLNCYTVPPCSKQPAPGYNWRKIGRAHSRDMYVANKCFQGNNAERQVDVTPSCDLVGATVSQNL